MTYSAIIQNRGRQVMSPLCVHACINIKRCLYSAQLHILLFHRIDADKICHLHVYIHTPTSTLLVFCATTYSVMPQDRGRQVMSPLRVYTYTNIKHYPCFVQLHILSFYRIEVKSCHLYVYIHTITSNVAPISE